jgi:hypothetical protein
MEDLLLKDKKRYRIIGVAISFLFLFSCQKQIEIDFPHPEKKLIVNGFLMPDSLIKIRVGKLIPFNNEISNFPVNDAVCEITEKGGETEILESEGNGFYSSQNITVESGKIYTLHVRKTDFPEVAATDTVPFPPTIDSMFYEHNTLYAPLDERYYNSLNVLINDDSNISNYYELSLILRDPDSTYSNLRVIIERSDDLAILNTGLTDYQPEHLPFSDAVFNGESYHCSAYYKLPGGSGPDFEGNYNYPEYYMDVHLNSCSYQYYQYSRSMILHLRNRENILFEWVGNPVSLYSNVEGGYGIFAAYCPYSETLHHESY